MPACHVTNIRAVCQCSCRYEPSVCGVLTQWFSLGQVEPPLSTGKRRIMHGRVCKYTTKVKVIVIEARIQGRVNKRKIVPFTSETGHGMKMIKDIWKKKFRNICGDQKGKPVSSIFKLAN